MKITSDFTVNKLGLYSINKKKKESEERTPITNTINSGIGNIPAYRDFSINFTGRTPEDFYAQDFNRENMPQTMKNFLDYDYHERQHIPPEQIMNEVFKYIKTADNLEEVKALYPKEELFAKLHYPAKTPRTGLLSEINTVKELSDVSLFKDGKDDLGLYLLGKIYAEGKTLNEIDRDFKKDMNPEYKGVITSPISYETTSAYGIRFPKQAFWHSFIHTRDDYKQYFINLPKNMTDPNRAGQSSHRASGSDIEVDAKPVVEKRKYTIKNYHKKQLKDEFQNTDMSEQELVKKIKRRFTKDDPEAHFIIKYMSPIMTVAAANANLSGEMKDFFNKNRIDVNNTSADRLKQFWKQNSDLKQLYAQSITDAIELFEDNYGAGGSIPINNEFKVITSGTENNKPVDWVTENYLDFLTKVKNIETERTARYDEHDKYLAELEEMFANLPVEEEVQPQPVVDIEPVSKPSIEEALKKTEKDFPSVNLRSFTMPDGTTVALSIEPEEVFRKIITSKYLLLPDSYKNKFASYALKHPLMTEDIMYSYDWNNCRGEGFLQLANPKDSAISEEDFKVKKDLIHAVIAEQLTPVDDVDKVMEVIMNDFYKDNKNYVDTLNHSIIEYISKLDVPTEKDLEELVLRKLEMTGNLKGNGPEFDDELTKQLYDSLMERGRFSLSCLNSRYFVYEDTDELNSVLIDLTTDERYPEISKEIDAISKKYGQPLSNGEKVKIMNILTDLMLNLDMNKTEVFKDCENFYYTFSETLRDPRYKDLKKVFKKCMSDVSLTSDNTRLRYLLEKNADKNLCEAIAEKELNRMIRANKHFFKMVALTDREISGKYMRRDANGNLAETSGLNPLFKLKGFGQPDNDF